MLDPKRILFVMRSTEYMHYYRTIIVALLHRGHSLRLLWDRRWSDESRFADFNELKKEFPAFSYGWAVPRTDKWRNILFYTRELLNYRRYLVVRKNRQSRYYEERYLGYLAPAFQHVIGLPGVKYIMKNALFGGILHAVERVAPAFAAITVDIRTQNPDIVIATPVDMRFASGELEYLKAAKAIKIPTVLPVISWDNLTTKGLIHIFPDRLLVWNDVQQEEAKEHQRFPADRIQIMGAPVFDVWFSGLKPSMTREQFCAMHGLHADDPIIAYLGSSRHMAGDETWLIEALRDVLDNADDPRVRSVQIIVRPHPSNFKIYQRLKERKNILFLPEKGTLPDSFDSLQLFYDTLYFSIAAIVGVNTSAIIDSIVAGKPAIAIVTEEYKKTQSETKHFKQLTQAGALELAYGTKDVPSIIVKLLDGNDDKKEKRMGFIIRYIRPHGIERSAGDVAADAIEDMLHKNKSL